MTTTIDLTGWTTEERNLAPAMVHAHYWNNSQYRVHGEISSDRTLLELDVDIPEGQELSSEDLLLLVKNHIEILSQVVEQES